MIAHIGHLENTANKNIENRLKIILFKCLFDGRYYKKAEYWVESKVELIKLNNI